MWCKPKHTQNQQNGLTIAQLTLSICDSIMALLCLNFVWIKASFGVFWYGYHIPKCIT